MAVAVTRPCIVCGTPMLTKRSSKKTCSNTCYMRHARALAKPVEQTTYTIQHKHPAQLRKEAEEYKMQEQNGSEIQSVADIKAHIELMKDMHNRHMKELKAGLAQQGCPDHLFNQVNWTVQ